PATCGPDNPLNPELDRGLSDLDVRHRLTFANVYDLPIGRGRRFGGNLPKALDFFIGGFQLNNIVTLQSGPVFSVTSNGGRVDIIGDPTPTAQDIAQGRQLNRNAFRQSRTLVFAADRTRTDCFNADGSPTNNCPVFGNLGRNTFRGNSQYFWDTSLFKNFPVKFISEAFNVQFRFQVYNVLNNVNRSSPNADIGSSDFGRDFSEQRRRQVELAIKLIF
ncbi:MAG: hypothetical protein ABI954_08130, partial [Pyrinomonadaceae bacterium]